MLSPVRWPGITVPSMPDNKSSSVKSPDAQLPLPPLPHPTPSSPLAFDPPDVSATSSDLMSTGRRRKDRLKASEEARALRKRWAARPRDLPPLSPHPFAELRTRMAMSTEMSGACPLLSLSGVDLDASRRSRMTGSTADEAWEQQLLESEAAVAAARAPVSRRRRRRGSIMVLLGRKWHRLVWSWRKPPNKLIPIF